MFVLPSTISETHDSIYNMRFEPHHTLKVLYLNANSVKSKQEEIEYILKYVRAEMHVIAITETWVQQGEEKDYKFHGYKSFYAGRPSRVRGGAAILIKDTIAHELIEIWSDNENSLVCIKLCIENEIWIISNIYRPPSTKKSKINIFIETLNLHLNKISNTTANILVTGDFNFNMLNENDKNVQRYCSAMLTHHLYIRDKTTITRDAAKTALDHIYTNIADVPMKLRYVPYPKLDHHLIFVEIAINTTASARDMERRPEINLELNTDRTKQRLTDEIETNITIRNELYIIHRNNPVDALDGAIVNVIRSITNNKNKIRREKQLQNVDQRSPRM